MVYPKSGIHLLLRDVGMARPHIFILLKIIQEKPSGTREKERFYYATSFGWMNCRITSAYLNEIKASVEVETIGCLLGPTTSTRRKTWFTARGEYGKGW